MQLACEFPVKYQESLSRETDFDFLLTHLILEDQRYRDFYVKQRKTTTRESILDCSIFELGTALSSEKVMEAAEIVNPHVIISPDVLHDAPATLSNLGKFLADHMTTLEKNKWTVAAVLHGKTLEEIKRVHDMYCNMKIISHICIPYDNILDDLTEVKGELANAINRLRVTSFLESKNLVNTSKKYHLLGLSYPFEVHMQKKHSWITSVDTSAPLVAAMQDINLFEIEDKLKRPKNYFEYDFNNETVTKMTKSLRHFRERII